MSTATIETEEEQTSFTYEQLSHSAQQQALCDYAESIDYNWWEIIYEDFENTAKEAGFEVGSTYDNRGHYRPHIYFSGFYSQGDGASFEGSFYGDMFKESCPIGKLVRDNYPELVAKIKALRARNKMEGYDDFTVIIYGEILQSGNYSHSHTMRVSGFRLNIDAPSRHLLPEDSELLDEVESLLSDAESEIEECLLDKARDLADDLYSTLEKEYDYLTGEESFLQAIEANEWRFDEDGSLV